MSVLENQPTICYFTRWNNRQMERQQRKGHILGVITVWVIDSSRSGWSLDVKREFLTLVVLGDPPVDRTSLSESMIRNLL